MENLAHAQTLTDITEPQEHASFVELAELELTMIGGGIGDVQI
jgi:hypothetical protein